MYAGARTASNKERIRAWLAENEVDGAMITAKIDGDGPRLVEGGAERLAIEAGQIDAIIDQACSSFRPSNPAF
jgi:hypothetical protein